MVHSEMLHTLLNIKKTWVIQFMFFHLCSINVIYIKIQLHRLHDID